MWDIYFGGESENIRAMTNLFLACDVSGLPAVLVLVDDASGCRCVKNQTKNRTEVLIFFLLCIAFVQTPVINKPQCVCSNHKQITETKTKSFHTNNR
jgi:hypothetical protein